MTDTNLYFPSPMTSRAASRALERSAAAHNDWRISGQGQGAGGLLDRECAQTQGGKCRTLWTYSIWIMTATDERRCATARRNTRLVESICDACWAPHGHPCLLRSARDYVECECPSLLSRRKMLMRGL